MDILLLDLDGTLVDAGDAIVDGVLELAADAGLPVPTRAWAAAQIGKPPEAVWRALGASDPVAMSAMFGARYGPGMAARTRALPGVEDALGALASAGVRMAVATTRNTASAHAALSATGLLRFIEHITGRDLVPAPKPAPDVALHALAALGASAAGALFVGDTDADVLCARAAGMPCWAVLGGHGSEETLRDAGAERILRGGFAELPRVLWTTKDSLT